MSYHGPGSSREMAYRQAEFDKDFYPDIKRFVDGRPTTVAAVINGTPASENTTLYAWSTALSLAKRRTEVGPGEVEIGVNVPTIRGVMKDRVLVTIDEDPRRSAAIVERVEQLAHKRPYSLLMGYMHVSVGEDMCYHPEIGLNDKARRVGDDQKVDDPDQLLLWETRDDVEASAPPINAKERFALVHPLMYDLVHPLAGENPVALIGYGAEGRFDAFCMAYGLRANDRLPVSVGEIRITDKRAVYPKGTDFDSKTTLVVWSPNTSTREKRLITKALTSDRFKGNFLGLLDVEKQVVFEPEDILRECGEG